MLGICCRLIPLVAEVYFISIWLDILGRMDGWMYWLGGCERMGFVGSVYSDISLERLLTVYSCT